MYTVVQLYRCRVIHLYRCTCVKFYRCTPVQLYSCTGVYLYSCTAVQVYRYTTVQLYSWRSVEVHICTSVQFHEPIWVLWPSLPHAPDYKANFQHFCPWAEWTTFLSISMAIFGFQSNKEEVHGYCVITLDCIPCKTFMLWYLCMNCADSPGYGGWGCMNGHRGI